MGALRNIGAAALIAGIVGIGIFVVFALDYLGGMSFCCPNRIVSNIGFSGIVWGQILVVLGILLLEKGKDEG